MTHGGPFQPLPCWDSVILHIRHEIWAFPHGPSSTWAGAGGWRAALIWVMPEQSEYPGVSLSQWLLSPPATLRYVTPRPHLHLALLIVAGNPSRERLWQPTLQLPQPRGNH